MTTTFKQLDIKDLIPDEFNVRKDDWKPTDKEIELSEEQEFKHKSPQEIAHALIANFPDYGYAKEYKIGSENKLLLVSMS